MRLRGLILILKKRINKLSFHFFSFYIVFQVLFCNYIIIFLLSILANGTQKPELADGGGGRLAVSSLVSLVSCGLCVSKRELRWTRRVV